MINNPYVNHNLTVIILCGGKGKRLRPFTYDIPKPLIKINEKPILSYIIEHLASYNLRKLIFATGYKSDKIYQYINDFFPEYINQIIDTGDVDIIERIKAANQHINSDFLVLYGDTISDIAINELIRCHQSKNKPITMTVWPLQIQFGLAEIDKEGKVLSFQEKPILDKWINIGYFFFKYDVFEVINEYNKFDKFLKDISNKGMVNAYKHVGRHITVNTIEELRKAEESIEKIINNGK